MTKTVSGSLAKAIPRLWGRDFKGEWPCGGVAAEALDLARRTGNVEVLSALDAAALPHLPGLIAARAAAVLIDLRRPRHVRFKMLASVLNHLQGSVRYKAYQAAKLLLSYVPELKPYIPNPELIDHLVPPALLETGEQRLVARREFDRFFTAEAVTPIDKRTADRLWKVLSMGARDRPSDPGDGTAIVQYAARCLGVQYKLTKRFYAGLAMRKSRAKTGRPSTKEGLPESRR